jgi:hypothetical protein
MLSILGFITGLAPAISQIANKITDLQMLKVKAQSDTELADINRRIEEAHDRRQILVAEAGQRIGIILNGGMRALMALPVAVFLWKWLVWDKVIGAFAHCAGPFGKAVNGVMPERCATYITDQLDGNTWLIVLGISGFYFAYDFGSKLLKR